MKTAYFDGGKLVYREMSQAEIEEQEGIMAEMPPTEPTQEERIAALEKQNDMLTGCILELSELLYN